MMTIITALLRNLPDPLLILDAVSTLVVVLHRTNTL